MNRGWEKNLDLSQFMQQFADDVLDDARRMVPVDTGALQESLRYEIEGKGINTVARVGSDSEYSVHVEMGTSSNEAQPYLRPAARRKRKY